MKKLISLILTLALMSTMLVFGGATAFAEEVTETVYATEHMRVEETGAYNAVTGHKVIYDSNTYADGIDNVAHGDTTLTKWVIFKFNIGEWDSISDASLTVKAYNGNSTVAIYAYKATPEDWSKAYEAAVTNGVDGVGTLDTNNLLTTPPATTHNPRKSVSTSKQTTTATIKNANAATSAQFASIMAYLKSPANIDADGNVYLGISIYRASNATGRVWNTNSEDACPYLTITGTRATNTPAVTDFSDAEITWDNGTCTVTTATTEGTAKLIVASFTGTTMNDAKVVDINAADAVEGVITAPVGDLEAGTVKIFLLDSTTLAPVIGVTTP